MAEKEKGIEEEKGRDGEGKEERRLKSRKGHLLSMLLSGTTGNRTRGPF